MNLVLRRLVPRISCEADILLFGTATVRHGTLHENSRLFGLKKEKPRQLRESKALLDDRFLSSLTGIDVNSSTHGHDPMEDEDDGIEGPDVHWDYRHTCLLLIVILPLKIPLLQSLLNDDSRVPLPDVSVETRLCEGRQLKVIKGRRLPSSLSAGGLVAPLLLPAGRHHASVLARRHLTTALSIPIVADSMAKSGQGTGGFYFHENFDKNGDHREKVLLVANHLVLCKRDDKIYDLWTHNSRRQKVRLCGLDRFQRGLNTLDSEVVAHGIQASTLVEEIGSLNTKVAKGNEDAADELKEALAELNKHRVAIVELEKFHDGVSSTWSSISHRGIGVFDYTPALSIDVDHERYTQDWATIRLDQVRFKPNFMDNIIDLGKISASDFMRLMNPRADTNTAVKYPQGGLLRIKGFLTKEQLSSPQSDGEPSLHVLKDGCTSQLTFGRCAGLESYTRSEDGVRSVELAIYNYDKQSKLFSSKGDLWFPDCERVKGSWLDSFILVWQGVQRLPVPSLRTRLLRGVSANGSRRSIPTPTSPARPGKGGNNVVGV